MRERADEESEINDNESLEERRVSRLPAREHSNRKLTTKTAGGKETAAKKKAA